MKKNIFLTILIIISLIFFLFVSINVFSSPNTLERGDDYGNIIFAKGIIKYNLMPLGDYDIWNHASDMDLNHPPLWFYIFAFIIFIFKNPISLNIFCSIFMISSAILIIKIGKLIFKDISNESLIVIYALFLFIPLIVRGSYIVDLDVILPFSMLLFTFFYLKNPYNWILNSVLFMLVWLTKIQGVPIIILALFLYVTLFKRTKKKYINYFLIMIIGSALFLATVFLFSTLLNVSGSEMFTHSSIIGTALKSISRPEFSLLTSTWVVKELIIWLLPSVLLLYVISIYISIKNKAWLENKEMFLPILISLITLLELIPIGTYGWNFPKYYLEFVPFMVLSMIPLIKSIKLEKKDFYYFISFLAVSILYFLIIPDPYLPEVSEAFTQKNYLALIIKVLFNLSILILPMLVMFLFYKGWKSKEKLYKALLIISFVMFISVAVMQITKPYSTNNIYGDPHADLTSTINYLKANTNSSDKLLLFDQVGYYFGNSDNTNWYNSMNCYNSLECMNNITNNKDVKFLEFYPKDLERLNGQVKVIISKNYHNVTRFGDYLIYERNSS